MKTHSSAQDSAPLCAPTVHQAVPQLPRTESVLKDAHSPAMAMQRLHHMSSDSPQTTQLKTLQAMMNASPRGQTLQAMVHQSAAALTRRQAADTRVAPPVQRMNDEARSQGEIAPVRRAKHHDTGLPDQLKSGIESLSGMSLDHVKVYYNSKKPAQLRAHAYAQGSEIHVAPGKEQYLPHEAWHVVQQAQGRVQATSQMQGGVPVNDDAKLESEADVMGARSLLAAPVRQRKPTDADQAPQIQDVVFHDIADRIAAPESEVTQEINEENSPAEERSTQQSFLVDGAGDSTGQMNKTSFLDALKSRISDEAEVELAKIGQTTENCPYLGYWISYYKRLPAKTVERAIKLYCNQVLAPDAQQILAVVTRIVIANLKAQIGKSPINPVTEDRPGELTASGAVTEALVPPKVVATQSETVQLGCCGDDAYEELPQNNGREHEDPGLSDDLKRGVSVLVRFDKVPRRNTIIERITEANTVHKKVFDLLTPIRGDIKTYMQGSGGQVQNALALIGKADNERLPTRTLENMVFNFCAVYDPNDLDFSDVDILIPVESTATFGKDILLQIKNNLADKGAEIRSAALLGGTSSFSHIFLKLDRRDIDIVIQDQRFAQLFAPRLPHMSARADIRGNPGFIRTHNAEGYDAAGEESDEEFSDLTKPGLTEGIVTEHMKGGLGADAELEGKEFDFRAVQDNIERQIVAFRQDLLDPGRGVNGGTLLGENMRKLIDGWKHKKQHKSEEIAEKVVDLEGGRVIDDAEDKQAISEATEFRKNQKQFYKSAKLVPDIGTNVGSPAHKKSVVAFYHMLAKHLNPGELSADQVADFTASLLAKKGFSDKAEQDKLDWLSVQIGQLKNVHTYFGALIAMNWNAGNAAVKNAAEYFLKQQAIFEELRVRIQSNVTQEQDWPANASSHLKERAYERGISAIQIKATLDGGDRYDDLDVGGATIYFDPDTGISVCEIPDPKLLTTCYKDERRVPKERWELTWTHPSRRRLPEVELVP